MIATRNRPGGATTLSIFLIAFLIGCQVLGYAAGIGSKVVDFQLWDANGREQSLAAQSGKLVVLIFWSFKCPVALAYTERIQTLKDKYAGSGVAVLAVESNVNESAAQVLANAKVQNLSVPIMLDSEGHLAEVLQATHTPSVFLVDKDRVLRYRGALDNNKKAGEKGRIAYVEEALDALLSGHQVSNSETNESGCRIQRKAALRPAQ